MLLQNITRLEDKRTKCCSIILETTIFNYLSLVETVYESRGGIKGQREPLKSSSALRIRKQMVKDIKIGTVLPPIVLGVIVNEETFKSIPQLTIEELANILQNTNQNNLTIIDGMQRTTALKEAIEDGAARDQNIRLELWVSIQLNSLFYRMLVLNTGQVPWNLRRQVETVFGAMIEEISKAVPEMEIYTIDDQSRRTRGGQYHANDVIELYLAFGGRKSKVNTKERLADEFTRLDFINAAENASFSDIFYGALKRLVELDIEICRFSSSTNNPDNPEVSLGVDGTDLFKRQSARVGFVTAMAKKIFGRPGINKSHEEILREKKRIFNILDELHSRLKQLNNDELGEFLMLDLIAEKLSTRTSRIGEFAREFFTKSFETLLEEGNDIQSFQVCWLAY